VVHIEQGSCFVIAIHMASSFQPLALQVQMEGALLSHFELMSLFNLELSYIAHTE